MIRIPSPLPNPIPSPPPAWFSALFGSYRFQDPDAIAYQLTTGIANADTRDISAFLAGLTNLGLRTNLVEAWLLQSRFQPPSGAVAYALLGAGNLTITGSPTREKQGFKLANSSPSSPAIPQYLAGNIPSVSGDLTILAGAFRPRFFATQSVATTGDRADVFLYGTTPLNWAVTGQYGSNYSVFTFNGANFRTSNIASRAPNEFRYRPTSVSNAAVPAADSLKIRIPGQTTVQITGHGSLTFNKITIGRMADNGVSGWKNYSDGIHPYCLLFNKVLSDSELAGVHALIDTTVHRKYRILIEGDSMSSDSVGLAMWIQDRPGFLGSNMDLVNLSAGGQTSTQMVAQIGTSAGIHDQGTTSMPVICTIWAGQNDRAINGVQTHANCRTLWAAAKARGMKVVAFTITKSSSITNDGWEANRQTANMLIRNDVGQGFYDYLVDADEFLASIATTDPYYDDQSLYSAADKVHLNNNFLGGNSRLMDHIYAVISAEIP